MKDIMERIWHQGGSTAKYNYNYGAFKVIDSEEKAYWLGFLYADGWVCKNLDKFALSISNKDRSHLERFRDFICPDKLLEEQPKQNSIRLTICSKQIAQDLVNLGCIPQKSLTLQAPTCIPDDLIRHFVRGYFDGDGCARTLKNGTRVSMSITGTDEIVSYCKQQFIQSGAVCRSKVFKAKSYNAHVWANESTNDLKIIYHYMYDGSHLFLNRKRTILEEVLNK